MIFRLRRIASMAMLPLLIAAAPQSPSDNLANFIIVMTMPGLPARGDKPATSSYQLTEADLDVVQNCKDDVAAGKRFPQIDEEPVGPPPGLINPLLAEGVVMVNRCLDASRLKGKVFVFASPNGVKHPQLH